ncbi:MAG: TrbI/VirB10 family protein [Opitutaceae bacterium]|jgi:hypothetical protein
MKLNAEFFGSTAGQWVLLGAALLIGTAALVWQHQRRRIAPMGAAQPSAPVTLPRVFIREGTRLTEAKAAAPTTAPAERIAAEVGTRKLASPAPTPPPAAAPLTLFAAPIEKKEPEESGAPYGRMIPCETVVTLESSRLETPVVGLVTEDVWDHGRVVIPAGAEVHGRAALDRTRERIAVSGAWVIVWRTTDADNGLELMVQGLALDREIDPVTKRWGDHDGSAGLRGTVVRTQDDRELRLFAATFLGAATMALQDTRPATGLFGEASVPAATVRNATLAGLGAILREEAQQIRDAIARDGFYLRVPSGKPFYLYVTQTLDRSQTRRGGPALQRP